MNMYTLIAAEYDRLFPHPQAKTDFVEKLLPQGPVSLLDLGCATGELLLSLVREDRDLTGIDLDGEMVRRALEKAAQQSKTERLNFLQFEMNTYLAHGEKYSRDMILIFGNTLAYLDGPEELERFIQSSYAALRPMGQIIIQVLNYDNPSLNEDFRFPELHTENIRFARSYSNGPRDNLLFHTELTDLKTGEKSTDIHPHYPFRYEDIRKAAAQSGFRRCLVYGGYAFEEIQGTDFSRLFVLRK
ncbi:MAG: class I SAM-dependent methyltransferase [Spirochaetales bacterium]|nr:class I SAM-dependent methyltransferase [Spirochaetales bacterium]